jgi:hypothetical protein
MQTLSVVSSRPPVISKGCIRFMAANLLLALSLVVSCSSAFAACISILSPAANSNVTGIVALPTNDSCVGVHFEALLVDGASKGAAAPGTLDL